MRRRTVKVLAGSLKGTKLDYPTDAALRPTMQKTKASVFETIGVRIHQAVFVDLFSAAGGMGIEALSRGARFAHFVESNREALRALAGNLDRCRLDDGRCAVHRMDAYAFLARADLDQLQAGIIYADPPYDDERSVTLLEIFQERDYHRFDLLIIEHLFKYGLKISGRLQQVAVKRFGQTQVSYFSPPRGAGT